MKDAKEIWDKILRPALGDRKGWAIFISTPNGTHNVFHELVLRAMDDDDYFYSHATALDNPHFPEDEFEQAREETPEDEFMQEWMADFRSMTTAVYPRFSRNKHLIKPSEIPSEGTDIIGVDFGFSDPFAAVFVRIDKDQNWYIYDEIYEARMTTEQAINVLRDKMGDRHFARILGDSAAATELETFKKVYNLPIVGAKKGKDTIKAGIREINGKLKVREGTGKPKLFVGTNCGNTIREFEAYEYMTNVDAYGERVITETPEDKNNNDIDALRYLPFKTSDLPLATYLYTKGMTILGTVPDKNNPKRQQFVFADHEERESFVEQFLSGDDLISASQLFRGFWAVKRHLHDDSSRADS